MTRNRAKPVVAGEAGAALAVLRQQSLTTLVQREIERRIIAGELPPGAKLNEAELAAEMGISRGPVREAFRALEQAGLVQTEKNRGVFVRQVSLEEANEIYEVRAALEGADRPSRRAARQAGAPRAPARRSSSACTPPGASATRTLTSR